MKAFLSKYAYLILWILGILFVGGLFMIVIELNGRYLPSNPPARTSENAPPEKPVPPPAPSITLTILKSKQGNQLIVQWQYLPQDTTALDIFRSPVTSSSTWTLWKSIEISAEELLGGNAELGLGSGPLGGYSYYVEAVGGGSSGGGTGTSTSTETILWTSSSTVPIITTSTPPLGDNGNGGNTGGGQGGGASPSSTPGGPGPTSTPSSTPPSDNPSSTPPSYGNSSSSPSSTSPSGPSGAPPETGPVYYNPQVQVSAYGSTSTNNFWVTHVGQQIELGWQDLPEDTDGINVTRSPDQDGPWSQILAEENPGVNGSSSLQIVDNTLDEPYYYELNALSGTTTIATYGPAYLPPVEQ